MALSSTPSTAASLVDSCPLLSLLRDADVPLDPSGRAAIAAQLAAVLRDYYVHLPLKETSLGIAPVREAELLVDDASYFADNSSFFRRLLRLMNRLRDRHTTIALPQPWANMVAYLPFTVESYYDGTTRHLVVSKVISETLDQDFQPGVEITYWNGTPIARHIESLSWDNNGANPFARIALALRTLTVRPLGYVAYPDEDWVTLSYATTSGSRTIAIPWRVYIALPESAVGQAQAAPTGAAAASQGLDRANLVANAAWKDLFSASAVGAPSNNYEYSTVETPSGQVGYIRIYSFDVDVDAFVSDMKVALSSLPSDRLLIDVRANPGGSIVAGEALAQMLSPRAFAPEPVSFRSTKAVRPFGGIPMFASWRRSMELQLETGELFSQGFPLSDGSSPKGIYKGAVGVITDALSYSTTDFFVAGVQDNGIGLIIGTDPMTGAGGANVWDYGFLTQVVASCGGVLEQLPLGIGLNVAMRRSVRVGQNADIPVEGLGTTADATLQLSRDDVLGENGTLIQHAASLLS